MIPKIIHYCWFGRGEKPELAKKCIASWKKFCPEYELIEWNEDRFDVGINPYTQMCYQEKKYAFLSDYVRLWAVKTYGGIYLDTDVELIKPLDVLLDNMAYVGFENDAYINTGLGFGSEPDGIMVSTMLAAYDALLDGAHGTIGCPTLNTQALVSLGMCRNGQLQKLPAGTVYPAAYLNPYDDAIGKLNQTPQTVSIHWYMKSALSKGAVLRSKLTRPLHRIFGTECFAWLRKGK